MYIIPICTRCIYIVSQSLTNRTLDYYYDCKQRNWWVWHEAKTVKWPERKFIGAKWCSKLHTWCFGGWKCRWRCEYTPWAIEFKWLNGNHQFDNTNSSSIGWCINDDRYTVFQHKHIARVIRAHAPILNKYTHKHHFVNDEIKLVQIMYTYISNRNTMCRNASFAKS